MKTLYEKFSGLNLLTLAALIVIILSSSIGVKSQIYTNDFESFTADQKAACQDPANWTIWTYGTSSADYSILSTDFGHSGVNSVKVDGISDLLLPMYDKTTGKYEFS